MRTVAGKRPKVIQAGRPRQEQRTEKAELVEVELAARGVCSEGDDIASKVEKGGANVCLYRMSV